MNRKEKRAIVIKDVSGENGWAILTLEEAGYPEGTIVREYKRDEGRTACYFGKYVAFIGETCELV